MVALFQVLFQLSSLQPSAPYIYSNIMVWGCFAVPRFLLRGHWALLLIHNTFALLQRQGCHGAVKSGACSTTTRNSEQLYSKVPYLKLRLGSSAHHLPNTACTADTTGGTRGKVQRTKERSTTMSSMRDESIVSNGIFLFWSFLKRPKSLN